MARLSFSRWPSLFFLISKPHQPTAHTCFTVLAAKNIREIDAKSDLWVKKYRHPRDAQGKCLKAPRECCVFYVSPSKKQLINALRVCLSHLCCKKTHNSGGSLFLFLKLRLVRKKFGEKIDSTFSVVIVGKLRVVHTE